MRKREREEKREKREEKEDGGRERERFEDAKSLALKIEERATSQEMQVASRSWERPENRFSSIGF